MQLLTGYSNKLIFLLGLSNSFISSIRDPAFIGDPASNWDPAFIRGFTGRQAHSIGL